MSLGEFATDVAAGSAVVLATGGLTHGVAWVRTTVRKFMHRATHAEQDAVITALADQDATVEELAARVTPLIEAHFNVYSSAVNEFRSLTLNGTTTYNQTNSGSGVFIGGNNHGGLTINQGGPA
ncbi:hypothetical protein [Streptomyces sp. V1I6]|uniref:hypothetical protein n=1 Tax=Streptomyces sp. V1I6 TaxID=3042273 RepID=UPI00278AC817|nr:hypothetical protein [Streptomyces sp. V1I6]MDQ0848045.1 hypothetical protein [Streptomyces sp. V1I6]